MPILAVQLCFQRLGAQDRAIVDDYLFLRAMNIRAAAASLQPEYDAILQESKILFASLAAFQLVPRVWLVVVSRVPRLE
jgi:hypothetical protein